MTSKIVNMLDSEH